MSAIEKERKENGDGRKQFWCCVSHMLVMVIMCVTVCNPARSRMRLGLGKSDVAFMCWKFTVYSERTLPLEQPFPKRPFWQVGMCCLSGYTSARFFDMYY